MIKAGKLYISVFFFVFIFVCVLAGAAAEAVLSYAALLIHEMFHIAFALKMKIPIGRFVVLPFGINIKIKDKLSYVNEIILCAMGPFGSLAVMCLCIYIRLNGVSSKYLDYFILANFSIFIINIFPIFPLDGGRIFKRMLESKTGHYRAAQISIWVSQVCVFIIFSFIFAAVVTSKFNSSIITLCCFLIYEISTEKNIAAKSFSELLIYSKEKLTGDSGMTVREIAVLPDCPIKNIFKMLSDSVYVMVTVTKRDGAVAERISETKLIERMCQKSGAKTIGDILK